MKLFKTSYVPVLNYWRYEILFVLWGNLPAFDFWCYNLVGSYFNIFTSYVYNLINKNIHFLKHFLINNFLIFAIFVSTRISCILEASLNFILIYKLIYRNPYDI